MEKKNSEIKGLVSSMEGLTHKLEENGREIDKKDKEIQVLKTTAGAMSQKAEVSDDSVEYAVVSSCSVAQALWRPPLISVIARFNKLCSTYATVCCTTSIFQQKGVL